MRTTVSRGGRKFVTAVLACNLWLLAGVVPLWLGRPLARSGAAPTFSAWGLLAIALIALGIGLRQRLAPLLLIGFPVATTAPLVLFRGAILDTVLTPSALIGGALALALYLLAASSYLEGGLASKFTSQTRPVTWPSRWHSRLRVYRLLTWVAIAMPLLLVGTGLVVLEKFPPSSRTLLLIVIGLLWFVVYSSYVLEPLRAHQKRDPELTRRLDAKQRRWFGSGRR